VLMVLPSVMSDGVDEWNLTTEVSFDSQSVVFLPVNGLVPKSRELDSSPLTRP